jgi:hypothetical protein
MPNVIPVRCKTYLLGCVQEPSFELHDPEHFFALDIIGSAFQYPLDKFPCEIIIALNDQLLGFLK